MEYFFISTYVKYQLVRNETKRQMHWLLLLWKSEFFWQNFLFATDDRTDVSCSLNYMRIEIDRTFFNASKYSTINLLDSKCKARLSSSKIILDTLPHLCGAKRVETNDHIIYQNEVYMKAKPTGKLVTREHDVRISFSCHYKKTAVLSQKSFDPQTIIDVKEGCILFKFWQLQLTFLYFI